jgi:hypothetical protein
MKGRLGWFDLVALSPLLYAGELRGGPQATELSSDDESVKDMFLM